MCPGPKNLRDVKQTGRLKPLRSEAELPDGSYDRSPEGT